MVKLEYSAGAIVYCMDDKPSFLFVQNTLKTTYWEFPKGKIEAKENIEETVKREVTEETNLKNLEIIPEFKHVLTWFFKFKGDLIKKEAVYLIVKIPKEDKNNVKISSEHEAFKWMTYEEGLNNFRGKHNKGMLRKAYEFILEKEKQKKLT